MPVALITAWLPSMAVATDRGTRTLARIRVIWPTSPAVLIGSASSMRRQATRTSTPVGASACTMARPTKPLPPKTVTCRIWFMARCLSLRPVSRKRAMRRNRVEPPVWRAQDCKLEKMEGTMPDTVTRPQAATQKVAHARIAEPVLVKGRREFFKYRDLGVAEASGGTMRAQVMMASQGMSRPTGWHYHECDGQFIYVMKGWVDLQFEDGRTIRVDEGDSLFIPGYLRHNEIRTADALEILEVSIPGELGTKPCEAPEGFKT